jgi:hypothetical protein
MFGFSFQIVPKPLFDDHPVFEDLYKVLGFDLKKIVCDNDGCLVLRQRLRASNTRIREVGSRADVASSIRNVSKETWNKNEN